MSKLSLALLLQADPIDWNAVIAAGGDLPTIMQEAKFHGDDVLYERAKAALARRKKRVAGRRNGNDNTYGMGHIPLHPRLAGIRRIVQGIPRDKDLNFTVFPTKGVGFDTYAIDIPLTDNFAIAPDDMNFLIYLGLLKIQAKNGGRTLVLYFQPDDHIRDVVYRK